MEAISLKQDFGRIFSDYLSEKSKPLEGNSLAAFIRNEISVRIEICTRLGTDFIIKGSPGQGNWGENPWIAIFDREITESAQSGFYPVFFI
jgi:5-methylcytosine-specific restriction protein A